MNCQYGGRCDKSQEAEFEAIRQIVPDGILGSTMKPFWQGFICKECLECIKHIPRRLKGSTIQFRRTHDRDWQMITTETTNEENP